MNAIEGDEVSAILNSWTDKVFLSSDISTQI